MRDCLVWCSYRVNVYKTLLCGFDHGSLWCGGGDGGGGDGDGGGG